MFVEELGGDGPLVDHEGGFERDAFDPFFEHLVLVDTTIDEASLAHVVGVYLADVRRGPNGPEPAHFREAFRATGPSNYAHGKQVDGRHV